MRLSRKVYFFADLHADPQAFENSLKHCTDPSALYLIGGDCLDKGPSNLGLLDRIKELSEEVEVKILAGNHDIRMLMVLQNWEEKGDPFSRFATIFTPPRWANRIRPFLAECEGIERAREIFLYPGGEYAWFFEDMELFHRDGEFLFVHAGVDDASAMKLSEILNNETPDNFPSLMRHREWCRLALHNFYHGPLGVLIRTKYRNSSYQFTEVGASTLKTVDINYVVHGHDSQTTGHKFIARHDIPHFACDCTLDANTRKQQGMAPGGYAFTAIDPDTGTIEGRSPEASLSYDISSGKVSRRSE